MVGFVMGSELIASSFVGRQDTQKLGPGSRDWNTRKVAFHLRPCSRTLSGMKDLQPAVSKISRLAGSGLDLVAFWSACSAVLADAVPHYQAPCWFTVDPAS